MSNKQRASEEALGLTHKEFADWCRMILKGVPLVTKEGHVVLDEEGKPIMAPPSPAHMNVIRQFLKDNSIEAAVIPFEGSGKSLDDLPIFDEDGVVVPIKKSSNSK